MIGLVLIVPLLFLLRTILFGKLGTLKLERRYRSNFIFHGLILVYLKLLLTSHLNVARANPFSSGGNFFSSLSGVVVEAFFVIFTIYVMLRTYRIHKEIQSLKEEEKEKPEGEEGEKKEDEYEDPFGIDPNAGKAIKKNMKTRRKHGYAYEGDYYGNEWDTRRNKGNKKAEEQQRNEQLGAAEADEEEDDEYRPDKFGVNKVMFEDIKIDEPRQYIFWVLFLGKRIMLVLLLIHFYDDGDWQVIFQLFINGVVSCAPITCRA